MDQIIILTPKEVDDLCRFKATVKQNVVIKSSNCGIGDAIKVTTQEEYSAEIDNWVNITDYDSW